MIPISYLCKAQNLQRCMYQVYSMHCLQIIVVSGVTQVHQTFRSVQNQGVSQVFHYKTINSKVLTVYVTHFVMYIY